MKFFSRLLLGLLLLAPSVAEAQKKDPGRLITTTPLPQVPELPDAFPQVLGTQVIGPAYKFTKEDPIVEGAMVVQNLGSRILKVQVPPGPQFNQLIAMPFTHYLVWFRSNGDWSKGFTPEMRRREYNATYAFTKDLLTRRETTGKTFFIGHWEGDWYLCPTGIRRQTSIPPQLPRWSSGSTSGRKPWTMRVQKSRIPAAASTPTPR